MNTDDPNKKFVQTVLAQAEKANATHVAIGVADGDATPVKYKVDGAWYDMAPPPARVRTGVVAELSTLASLSDAGFPKRGSIATIVGGVWQKWDLEAPSADGEWLLTRVT